MPGTRTTPIRRIRPTWYQRWYPSAVVLPNKKVLILNGTDQDTSLGPPADDQPCSSETDNTPCSKVRQTVPELYDPEADQTIALENAQKLQPMYARSYVVQTGRGWHDWKVASVGEADPIFLPTLEDHRRVRSLVLHRRHLSARCPGGRAGRNA